MTRGVVIATEDDDGWDLPLLPVPPSHVTEMPNADNDEGGGLCNLKADSPPPPPSWLVCEFCLPERMHKKDK